MMNMNKDGPTDKTGEVGCKLVMHCIFRDGSPCGKWIVLRGSSHVVFVCSNPLKASGSVLHGA